MGFNPRAHGGRDMYIGAFLLPNIMFQSTRPQGARPNNRYINARAANVSIHAPTGGATSWLRVLAIDSRVSIHAPTGGATGSCLLLFLAIQRGFNPRAHGGRDSKFQIFESFSFSFNPRAHGGRDKAGT